MADLFATVVFVIIGLVLVISVYHGLTDTKGKFKL